MLIQIHAYGHVNPHVVLPFVVEHAGALGKDCRWGIASGMLRDYPIWRCPYTQVEFRSKSYSAYKLKQGVNYAQLLKMPPLQSTQKAMQIPGDEDASTPGVVTLPEMKGGNDYTPIIIGSKISDSLGSNPAVEVVTHPSLEAYREPQVKGGKITMVDSDGNRMFIDENGIITYDSEQGLSNAPTFLHNSDPDPPTCRVGGDSLPQESSKLSKGTCSTFRQV